MTRRKIPSFLSDYDDALKSAKDLDSQIITDASAISADYAAVVSLSIRQAFGATEITLPRTTDGSWNTSDVLMFMKGTSNLCSTAKTSNKKSVP